MKKPLFVIGGIIFAVILYSVFSGGSNRGNTHMNFQDWDNLQSLSEYEKIEKGEAKDLTHCYVDMSNGMKVPFRNDRNCRSLFADLRNSLQVDKTSFYKIAGVERDGEDLFNLELINSKDFNDSYFANVNNYNTLYASLDRVVKKIAENPDEQSILVTDGELAKQENRFVRNVNGTYNRRRIGGNRNSCINPEEAWARDAFRKVLENGGEIDFVIRTFNPGASRRLVPEMRLFFIFFTPRSVLQNTDITTNIENFLRYAKDKKDQYVHLNFSVKGFKVKKENRGMPKNQRGFNTSFLKNLSRAEIKIKDEKIPPYEVIMFEGNEDRALFTDYIYDFINGNAMQEDYEKNKFLYDINLDLKNPNYKVNNFALNVWDITATKEEYLERKENNEYVEEYNKLPVEERAEGFDGKIKEYEYNKQKVRKIKDIFKLKTNEIDSNKFSFYIKFNKSFSFEEFENVRSFRIDLYLKDVEFQEQRNFDLLKWNDYQFENSEVNGLYASMKYALSTLEPRNKNIYTYYFSFRSISSTQFSIVSFFIFLFILFAFFLLLNFFKK